MSNSSSNTLPPCPEHRVQRDRGSLHVRDFPGDGPPYVLLHGFPDNSHIYDHLIPHLAAGGRRTVALDFLGFGESDKPDGVRYSFAQQLAELEAVVEHARLDRIVPVGHDAGGPAAINFSLKHADRTAAVVLMNAFYGDTPGLCVPAFIDLFSNKRLAALHRHFLASPEQFAWLLAFQRDRMQVGLTDAQSARYRDFLGPVIDDNFRRKPGAGPAFAQMTAQLLDELAANAARLVDFRCSEVPLLLIWGRSDPYLHVTVAEHMRSQARAAMLQVLDAGHWPQIDADDEVARIMLANC